ncbi:MAG: triose-phosphate isomerase, partial [bacterium]|nr:triose-phosphate isomerase [bacterium]
MKNPLVVGNWKLHHNLAETVDFLSRAVVLLKSYTDVKIVIAPVATLLYLATEKTKNSNVSIAAQNVYFKSEGAFTGEWSVLNLTELGCKYVIVGHSERRQYFNETNETVALKVKTCFEGNISPIVCLGESLEIRKTGQTRRFLQEQ